jgi:integrase
MTLFKRCTCPTAARCDHPWTYEFELRGRRYRKSTRCANKTQAERIAGKAWERANGQQTGTAELEPAPRLSTHVKDYEEWAEQDHPATAESKDKRVLASFAAVVGGSKPIDQITSFDIERWRKSRTKKVERTTVNRELNVISGLFSKAVEWKRLARSPIAGVARYATDDPEVRTFSRDELRTILTAAPADLALIIRVTVECLPRLSEVLGLRKEHVGAGWIARRLKGGKWAQAAVTPELSELLLKRADPKTGWVFGPKPPTQAATSVAYTRLFRRLGISGVSHHTARHTGVTLMLDAGVNVRVIQRLAGWTSLRMLERYGHVRDAEMRRAVEATAKEIAAALTSSPHQTPQ